MWACCYGYGWWLAFLFASVVFAVMSSCCAALGDLPVTVTTTRLLVLQSLGLRHSKGSQLAAFAIAHLPFYLYAICSGYMLLVQQWDGQGRTHIEQY
jgi:hypothetical protein